MSSSSSSSSSSRTKQVVFVRHAQSEENVKFQSLVEGALRLRQGRLPGWRSVVNGVKLLRTDLDSELSGLGRRQVLDMAAILKSVKFVEAFKPDLVLHSPLRRAKETLLGVLPSLASRAVELECLREATPLEHVFPRTLDARLRAFTRLLADSSAQRIVVCGHSQFFKRLLRSRQMMRNVDLWQAELVVAAQGPGAEFANLRLLHRSELAPPHPLDAGSADLAPSDSQGEGGGGGEGGGEGEGRAQHTRSYAHVINDLDPNSPGAAAFAAAAAAAAAAASGSDTGPGAGPGPGAGADPWLEVCWICQGEAVETPELGRLIRPCRCSAVCHLACLNQWRATSNAASSACGICRYSYRVTRSPLAQFLLSDAGALVVTAVLLLVLVFAVGGAAQNAGRWLGGKQKTDLAALLYRQAGLSGRWRLCSPRQLQELLGLGFRRAAVEHAVRSGADSPPSGFFFWPRLIRAYVRVFSGWHLLDLAFCQPSVVALIDYFVLGLAALCAAGVPLLAVEQLRQLRQIQAEAQAQRLGVVGVQLVAWWGGGQLGRLAMLLGGALAAREVYRALLGEGRRLALALGETIEEPGRG